MPSRLCWMSKNQTGLIQHILVGFLHRATLLLMCVLVMRNKAFSNLKCQQLKSHFGVHSLELKRKCSVLHKHSMISPTSRVSADPNKMHQQDAQNHTMAPAYSIFVISSNAPCVLCPLAEACSTTEDGDEPLHCPTGYECHIINPGNPTAGIPNRGQCIKQRGNSGMPKVKWLNG